MFNFWGVALKNSPLLKSLPVHLKKSLKYRTFLSQAYYCNEIWQNRLNNPLFKKINVDQFYSEIDQKFNSTKTISAVDVDIFVNAINDPLFADELLDLVHKLRTTADTGNTLDSTQHAVVRNLIQFGKKEELLNALDDRLNYGLFLDNYTACLLMDTFWKQKDYVSGARVAAQMMLQEDFEHVLCANYALLHCYNYLSNSLEWPCLKKSEEEGDPDEVTLIRVKYVRNLYDDNHFDLKDGNKIVGKTIKMITKNLRNTLEKSMHLVGLALFDEYEQVQQLINKLVKNEEKVYNVSKLIPEENRCKPLLEGLEMEDMDLQQLLQDAVKSSEQIWAEKDIALQCETYLKWDQDRLNALEKQKERYLIAEQLSKIEQFKEKMDEKEKLLWYFENEEKYELAIEERKMQDVKRSARKAKLRQEEYIPPEVGRRQN